MSPISIAAIFLASTCAAAAIGLVAQRLLPEHHLSSETKDTVRLAIGTITAMTPLILGLATASAKNAFDLACRNVNESAVDLITIDRMLKRYGEEAADIRADVEQMIRRRLDWLAVGKQRYLSDPGDGAALQRRRADQQRRPPPRGGNLRQVTQQPVPAMPRAGPERGGCLRGLRRLARPEDAAVLHLRLIAGGPEHDAIAPPAGDVRHPGHGRRDRQRAG